MVKWSQFYDTDSEFYVTIVAMINIVSMKSLQEFTYDEVNSVYALSSDQFLVTMTEKFSLFS